MTWVLRVTSAITCAIAGDRCLHPPQDGRFVEDRQPKSERSSDATFVAGLIVASLLFLYLHLFVPPFTPIWTGGDESIFLHDASRMLDGQVVYRDFAQMTFPATDVLYFLAFKIFGLRMWIPNAFLVVLGVSLSYLTYGIAKRIEPRKTALLAPLLFLTLVYRNRLDATHHWFSALATLAALAILVDRRTRPRVALAGVFCGIGACFTQNLGFLVLLAIGLFLHWEARRSSTPVRPLIEKQLLLVAGFAVALGAGTFPIIHAVGWRAFTRSTLIFSFRYYPTLGNANNLHGYMAGVTGFLHWQRIPDLLGFIFIHALLPLVYILFFVRYRRDSPQHTAQPWDALMLTNLVGVFSLLSVAGAPTWARLYYVSLPALILFVWFLRLEGPGGKIFSKLLLGYTTIFLVVFPLAKQFHHPAYLDLPTGRTAFLNRDAYDRYRWAASQTQPSDFFFGGLFPDFYFILQLRNPGPVAFVTPYEYTRPEEVQALLEGLEQHHVKTLLWTPALDVPSSSQGDHLPPLRLYVRQHYHVSTTFPEYQVWTRND
jgi:hypothetical protein